LTDNVVPLPLAGDGFVVGELVGTDVAELAAEFPDFEIGTAYVTAASGPDYRYLWARGTDRVLIAAPDKSLLAEHLRRATRAIT
jgi:hypothetical protein